MFDNLLIDPGHGGSDDGFTMHGVREADLNLAIARYATVYAAKLWEDQDIYVTRDADETVPLPTRNDIAEDYGCELVISIHCNASRTRDQHGGLALYWSWNTVGRAVADKIAVCLPLRSARQRGEPVGEHYPRAYEVIRAYRATTVLVECGYLDCPTDAAALQRPEIQQETALAVVQGVARWRAERLPF